MAKIRLPLQGAKFPPKQYQMEHKNNHILAISLETECEAVASTLESEKENHSLAEIAFHGAPFDNSVNDKFVEILRFNDRSWRKIEFINCTGQLELAIESSILVDRVEAIYVVRKIEPFTCSRRLATLLGNSTTLKRFRLTTTLEKTDASSLGQGLADNRSLKAIDFRWTVFQPGSIAQLVKGFALNQHLEEIDFFGCELDDEDVSMIISSLRYHPNLKFLLLNGNKCCFEGSEGVGKMLERPDSKLVKLDLSFQRLEEGVKLNITSIMNALKSNHSLIALDLTCSRLDDTDALKIAEALEHNKTLKELFLARNKFTDIGISLIANRLPKMRGLKKLSLWGNSFGEEGARDLLAGVKRNTELCDLHLFRKFECSDKILYFTNINRGGRKLLQEAPNEVPMSLWPRVLARANTMKMPPRRKADNFQKARIDMLYCLIRGPVLFSRGLEYVDIQ